MQHNLTIKTLGDINGDGSEWWAVNRGPKRIGHIEKTEDYSPNEGETFVAWEGARFSDFSSFEEARAYFEGVARRLSARAA